MDFRELRRESQRIGNALAREQGLRDSLQKQFDDQTALVVQCAKRSEQSKQAHLFILSEIVERRQKALHKLEEVATASIRSVYGDDFSVRFETFDQKRKEDGVANFKMEVKLVRLVDGVERTVPVTGGVGGGAYEVSGHIIRFAVLELLKYAGPLVMDEAFGSMSDDAKIEEVAMLIRTFCHMFNRQVIFCTHDRHVFGPIADSILYVTQNDKGIARVDRIIADGAHVIDEEDYEYDG